MTCESLPLLDDEVILKTSEKSNRYIRVFKHIIANITTMTKQLQILA